jgi:predicted esterase
MCAVMRGVALVLIAVPLAARAQAVTTSTAGAPAAVAVSRADLAGRYLAMDGTYTRADAEGRITDSTRALVNRTFDKATLSFFGGRFAAAIASIDSSILLLSPGQSIVYPPRPAPSLVNGAAPRVAREALLARLSRLDSTGALAQAIVSATARAQLLVDTPNPERSAEFLSVPQQLAAAVTREVASLEKGRNPYAGFVGDLWRTYRGANGSLVPMRVVAPKQAAGKSPIGVLIALHGAGGDENMFVDAYGQGVAAKLALEHGLLFVSPATTLFMTSPEQFDVLMRVLAADYRLDATRVYVIGHSMGSGAAARLAQLRPDKLAAVACLAGGSAVTAAGAPPMLFIGAQLDPIIPARTVQAAAKGTPSGSYEERANEGHTLMVRGGAMRAVPWLVQQHR